MITKNYKNFLKDILQRGPSRYDAYEVKTVSNGTRYTIGEIFGTPTTTVATTATAAGIHIGSGTTAATENDYKLENQITSGFSASVTVSHSMYNGIHSLIYDIMITNTGSSSLTISEIGYVQNVSSSYVTSAGQAAFLIDRTVLTEPVTIAAGDYEVIRYTLKTIDLATSENNIYTSSDEGKVVSNGELIAQTGRVSQITENGIYDTTTNNSVTVNVSGGGGDLYSLWTEVYDNPLPTGVSVSTPTLTAPALAPAWIAYMSQNVKDFINNECRISARSSSWATGTTISTDITKEMAQRSLSQITADPNYFGGLAEYYGNLYGSALLTTYNMVLLGDFSQGGSASGNALSDAITNYSAVALQGIYRNSRTSGYNTTIIYPLDLNVQRWTGMKDRNSSYDCNVIFTDAQTVSLSGNKQVIIYGIP